MERYIVIDLQEKTILTTSDYLDETCGGSVKCESMEDFKQELEETLTQALKDSKRFEEM